MRRWFGVLCAVALWGCGGEDDGGGGGVVTLPDAAVEVDAEVVVEPHVTFCGERAAAVCGWGYGCFGENSGSLRIFGLGGPTEAACVADQTERCVADLDDRFMRGTLVFSTDGAPVCVQRLAAAPCLDTSPSTWVGQWQDYVQNNCGSVARGSVTTGGVCRVQADCASVEDACVDGACGPIPPASLVQVCAGGDLGVPVADAGCPTGTCVDIGGVGVCSASCAGGRRCGAGGTCIIATALGGAPRPYCARSCFREGDPFCGDDFACATIGESESRACQPPE